MEYLFTAVISEKNKTFYAKVPDIDGCITTAATLSKAIDLISDALSLCLVVSEDEKLDIPAPSRQADILHNKNDILTVIKVDTIKYRSLT